MKSVLLIDEDPEFRAALREWLGADGWRVLEADNGEIGLEIMRQSQPGLVICDLLMPRCNGFRFCRFVHEDPNLARTKIIISSGRGYPADRLNALEAGADEYLVKPANRSELKRLLASVTSGKTSREELIQQAAQGPRAPRRAERGTDTTIRVVPRSQPTVVRFWGVRGSIPTPGPSTVHYGGNTSCIEVRADGELIILDAGSGIRPLGLSLVEEFKDRPISLTVLISHTHWDHIQGFPFFVPAYNPKNNVRICGYEGSREGLQATFSSQMESPYFPISMHQMPGHVCIDELQEMQFNIGKVKVEASFTNHPGICVGYRLNTSCGSIAYLPDNEPYLRLRGSVGQTRQSSAESITYARKQDEQMIEFIRNTEVLIIDSQYDDDEYSKHVGWGHGCLDDVVTLALAADVKQLFLFHHDPGHDDDGITNMVKWARGLVNMHGETLRVEAAREGMEIVLAPAVAAGRTPRA